MTSRMDRRKQKKKQERKNSFRRFPFFESIETSGGGREPCAARWLPPVRIWARKNPFYFLYLSNQSSINFLSPFTPQPHNKEPHFLQRFGREKTIFKMIYITVWKEMKGCGGIGSAFANQHQ